MAKRKKPTTSKKETKTATPEKPKPEGPSAVSVNPAYDEMPDKVEDPAAVFKMAMLDQKRQAAIHKLAVVAQEHDRRVKAAEAARQHDLNQVKAELRDVETALKAQKDYIEKQYGIALRSYTYNDETGVLTKQALPEEEEQETDQSTSSVPNNGKAETLH